MGSSRILFLISFRVVFMHWSLLVLPKGVHQSIVFFVEFGRKATALIIMLVSMALLSLIKNDLSDGLVDHGLINSFLSIFQA